MSSLLTAAMADHLDARPRPAPEAPGGAPGVHGAAADERHRSPSPPVRWGTTAVLAAVALAARGAYWWATADVALRSDAGQYHALAGNLASGRGYVDTFPQLFEHPTAFRPPLLPALLSLPYRLFGSHAGVGRATAVAIGVVLVVVVHRVVARHLGGWVATAAAALVAVYPPLVANDVVPLTESLSLVLLVATVHLAVAHRWLLAGVACGLLVLARPSAQGLVVVLVAWALATGAASAARRWRPPAAAWRSAAAVVVGTVAVVAPWVVRNAVQVGAPVVVTSNGFNLAAMHSAEAQARGAFVDPVVDPGFDDLRFVQLDEAGWDRALRSRALDDLAADPASALRVVGRNTLAFFELRPDWNRFAEEADGRHAGVRAAALPLFYVVTVVGAVGLWLGRRSPFVALLALCAAWFALTSLVLVAPPRLRAPVDLACCVGTAVAAVRWWPRVAATRTGRR